MILEFKRNVLAAIDSEVKTSTDGLLQDTARDVGDMRARIGYIRGLLRTREIMNETLKDMV